MLEHCNNMYCYNVESHVGMYGKLTILLVIYIFDSVNIIHIVSNFSFICERRITHVTYCNI